MTRVVDRCREGLDLRSGAALTWNVRLGSRPRPVSRIQPGGLPGWSVGRVDGVAVAVALFDQIQLRPGMRHAASYSARVAELISMGSN